MEVKNYFFDDTKVNNYEMHLHRIVGNSFGDNVRYEIETSVDIKKNTFNIRLLKNRSGTLSTVKMLEHNLIGVDKENNKHIRLLFYEMLIYFYGMSNGDSIKSSEVEFEEKPMVF